MDSKIEKVAKTIVGDGATVVYSAILIDDSDKRKILADSVHPNKYGEHVTLQYFGSKGGTDTPFAGKRVAVELKKHYADEKGEAWTVQCNDADVQAIKDASQTLHVTVSCADGTKPFYSNQLIKTAEADDKEGYTVHGRIAYFMSNHRWIA